MPMRPDAAAADVAAFMHRHERAEKEKDELHLLLAQIMSFTNVAFFGLAGASLKLVRAPGLAIGQAGIVDAQNEQTVRQAGPIAYGRLCCLIASKMKHAGQDLGLGGRDVLLTPRPACMDISCPSSVCGA